MRDWKEQMHNSTVAIISAITKLHRPSSSAENSATVCDLVKAMANVVEIQGSVNTKLQQQLREHQRRLIEAERRLTYLQDHVKRAEENSQKNEASPESDFEEFDLSSQAVCRRAGRKRPRTMGESPLRPEQETERNRSLVANRRIHDVSKSSQPSILESNSTTVRQKPPQLRSSEDRLFSKYEDKELSLPTREVKPPFTTADIIQERNRRRKEKRDSEKLQPFPCDKCCRIKLEEIKKRYGCARQDLLQKYRTTRGACYFYAHADEELPDDHPRSQISFDDSATPSPEHLT